MTLLSLGANVVRMESSSQSAPPAPAPHKSKKQRSPSYPAIGLKEAIERARVLYQHEGRNPAPTAAVVDHWGYSEKSSGGRLALAALKKYGLVDDEGSKERRQIRLTPLALAILLDEREGSQERAAAIRDAALLPTVHRELIEKYPDGLPSDANLRYHLSVERAFTDAAVKEFVPRFRETMAFAGLPGNATLSPDEEDKPPTPPEDESPDEETLNGLDANPGGGTPDPPPPAPLPPTKTAHREVQVPLSGADWVTVQGAFPLTEQAWDQMIAVLNAMKPGLITPPDSSE